MDHARLTVLNAAAWTDARHSIDEIFGKLLPWWWNSTLILLFCAAYLNQGPARWLFFVSALLLIFGIAVTLIVEVPINKRIASWTSTTIPPNWMELRDRWLKFHNVRSGAGLLAFACALLGIASR